MIETIIYILTTLFVAGSFFYAGYQRGRYIQKKKTTLIIEHIIPASIPNVPKPIKEGRRMHGTRPTPTTPKPEIRPPAQGRKRTHA